MGIPTPLEIPQLGCGIDNLIYGLFREGPFEKCWGGGKHANSVLDLGGGGGQVNSALDLGGSCKFRIRGKKPVTLHFSVSVQYSTGTPFRYCVEGGVKGEVTSGSAPPVWI